MNDDVISRAAAIEVIDAVFPVDPMKSEYAQGIACGAALAKTYIEQLPPAQQQYEPVTAEDFAKTMSENSLYNFVAWHQEALTLMKEHGFVICKKTM